MLNVNKNVRTKYQQIIYYFVWTKYQQIIYYFVCWYFVSWLFFLPPVVIDSFIEWVSKEEPDPPILDQFFAKKSKFQIRG